MELACSALVGVDGSRLWRRRVDSLARNGSNQQNCGSADVEIQLD